MTSYNAEKGEAEKMMRAADEKLLIKALGPNFEIAARLLCLLVCGATPRFTAAVKIPLPRQHFSSRILFNRKLSESYFF